MLDFNTYKSSLLSNGANLAQVRRNQSDTIINATFTGDPTYKRVKILTSEGWQFEDAKYQKHTTPSILKDEVDYYLQFRPGVHFKLGTYVIVPDDTSPEIDTGGFDDPFDQDPEERTQWWLIVGRTDANAYVRYSILKCNWNFEWIYNGEIKHCYGCVRNANSYTSGIYINDKTTTLDNINSGWLPDVYWTYDDAESLGLDDIRSIHHEMRFMISDNSIYPKTYEVSKVTELVPAGIIKLTMKQVPYNEKRDNIPLRICDYYDENGVSLVDKPTPVEPTPEKPTSQIYWMQMNKDGELVHVGDNFDKTIYLRKSSYFYADYSDGESDSYIWDIKLVNEDKISDEEVLRLEQYMEITDYTDGSISIKPNRIRDLVGKKFILSVSDEDGEHHSSIEVEVGD